MARKIKGRFWLQSNNLGQKLGLTKKNITSMSQRSRLNDRIKSFKVKVYLLRKLSLKTF